MNNFIVVFVFFKRISKPFLKQACDKCGEHFCLYDTAVMYDKHGKYVARYHKYNLFNTEFPLFNIDEKEQNVFIDTDYGRLYFKCDSFFILSFLCPIVLRVYLSNHFLILRSSWVHSLWRFTMVFSNCWFGKIEQNRYFDFRYGMVGSISSSTSSCTSTIMGKITPGMKWKVSISRGLVHWK